MRKQRPKIRKEDIGDPSNFVHIQHAGFGPKLTAQRSFDLDRGHGPQDGIAPSGSDFPGENSYDEFSKVERRIKGSRNSRIPRHHRSTTAGLVSENSQESRDSSQTVASLEPPSPRISESNGTSLKPTFGSLLNLSFLPLGLGKSSSKSTSVGKTKRMSLLNLTASNLFAAPKAVPEEKRESVHMTGYTRRRSFSSSVDGDEGSSSSNVPPTSRNEANESNSQAEKKKTLTARVPLAKLGRSKSTMAEFSKRPKLRLVLPPAPPPPVPPHRNIHQEATTLPSPPPTPEPSPPNTPSTAPVENSVILRPFPQSRSRIIPLPSTSSLDSGEPSSPQYLTPAGGCSPLANSTSSFPLLSPTLPPTSTPLFPTQRSPGTPPVWPLQPTWPSVMAMVHKEATIPELPSPLKEDMETNEYDPVVPIVDSFISEQIENGQTATKLPRGESVSNEFEESHQSVRVTSTNAELISTILYDHIPYNEWPGVAQKLFSQPTSSENENASSASDGKSREIYRCLLTKTLELWTEITGAHEITKRLADSLEDINYQHAADMLRRLNLQNDCDSQL